MARRDRSFFFDNKTGKLQSKGKVIADASNTDNIAQLKGSTTGNPVQLISVGDDTNIDLRLSAKGSGNIELLSTLEILTGKRIIDSAGTNVEFGDPIQMNSNKIVGLGTPTASTDAATKAYVDSGLSSLSSTTLTEGNSTLVVADSGTGTITATIDGTTHSVFAAAGITLSQGEFVGDLTGNADTADAWSTARTLSLTGAVTGSASVNGSGDVSITTTATSDPVITLAGDATGSVTLTNLGNGTLTVAIVDDSHNHIISNVDGLQAALDLKAPLAGPAFTGTATAVNLTLSGDLTVNGTTTTLNTTNTVVSDNLIELNNGATSNANDSGIVIERGSTGDNAFMGWDESADSFIVGTTTATGASTGDLTITAAPLSVSALTASSGAFSGNVTFGDSNKAIFGAGSDLQIYHDGSHSYISDQGTGNLRIAASDRIQFYNAATDEVTAQFIANGEAELRYDNTTRLATTSTGIDVTGNITVSGTVDGRDVATDGTKLDGIASGATAYSNSDVDAHLNQSNPTSGYVLSWNGTDYAWVAQSGGGNSGTNHQEIDDISGSFNGSDTAFSLTVSASAITPSNEAHVLISVNGIIQEPTTTYTISGSTITFTTAPQSGDTFFGIHYASLNIGTPSNGTVGTAQLTTSDIDLTGALSVGGNLLVGTTTLNSGTLGSANTFAELAGTANGSGTLILSRQSNTNNDEVGGIRFVNSNNFDDDGLDADGKLIATISGRTATSDSNASDDAGGYLTFSTKPEAGNHAERMRITSTGNIGIGDTAPSEKLNVAGNIMLEGGDQYMYLSNVGTGNSGIYVRGNTAGSYLRSHTTGIFTWEVTGSEKMRITSDGKVGIGTTSPYHNLQVAGTIKVATGNGQGILALGDGNGSTNNVAIWRGDANAPTTDGNLLNFGAYSGMVFAVGNTAIGSQTERMRLDGNGRLGIGTTAPDTPLHVNIASATGYSSSSRANTLTLKNTTASGYASMEFLTEPSSGNGGIATISSFTPSGGSAVLSFGTRSGSTLAERMRIDGDGKVCVGTTSAFDNVSYTILQSLGGLATKIDNTGATTQVSFFNPNGRVGYIGTSGTTTSYNTSSDYRLKENVVGLTGAIDRIKQVPVRRFNFISEPDKTVDGFIAHEVSDIVPEAITGLKDEVNEEGNPVYQGIDQSKLVPLLTAALQEAIAEIENLKTRIEALEG